MIFMTVIAAMIIMIIVIVMIVMIIMIFMIIMIVMIILIVIAVILTWRVEQRELNSSPPSQQHATPETKMVNDKLMIIITIISIFQVFI